MYFESFSIGFKFFIGFMIIQMINRLLQKTFILILQYLFMNFLIIANYYCNNLIVCRFVIEAQFLFFSILILQLTNSSQLQSEYMSANFEFLGKIGQGSFATVYKVKRTEDSTIYAFKKMKAVKMNDRQLNNCLNQIRILASLNNPYIIAYKQAFYDSALKSFCLVTQFAEGGDLSVKINTAKRNKQTIPQMFIWKTALQLLHGIKALHAMKIFHRDIKPANILLTKNGETAKLADLNVSVISKTGLASTQTGTPSYASPEVWMEKPYSGKSDIWSLGCILYQLAAQRPPFLASDLNSLKRRIIQFDIDPLPSFYSKQLTVFIKICLQKDQKIRPTAQQILNLPQIKQKSKQFASQNFNQPFFPCIQKPSNMVGTIRIQNGNLKSIQNKLPKCNYSLDKQNDNLGNRINENLSCLPKLGSKQQTKNGKQKQKLPLLKRCDSAPKVTQNVPRRQVIKKLRC